MNTAKSTDDARTARLKQLPLITQPSRRNAPTLASDLLPLCDFVCLILAASFATTMYQHWQAPLVLTADLAKQLAQATLVAAVLAPFILYDQRFGALVSRGQFRAAAQSYALRLPLLSVIVATLGAATQTLANVPFAWLAIWFTSSLFATLLTRILVALRVAHLARRGELTKAIAIVGAGPVADRLVQALRQSRKGSIELLGIFDDKIIGAVPSVVQSSGNIAQLVELARSCRIDRILITLPPTAERRLLSIVERLKVLSVPISLCEPHVGLVPIRSVDYIGESVPVTLLAQRPINRWNAVAKSSEDLVVGAIITLLLLPVLALVALAIKLSGPGPVIFTQRRHTLNNSEFDIYKFRTMRWNPAAANNDLQQTTRHDIRVTAIGRFLRASSLDELPQLFNVLKGEMSLVGPRPHAVNMRTENQLGTEIIDAYPHRHRVKPGMTGWSQINGARGATDTTAQLRRRIELDLHYIDNWSLLLDLKILALTSREVLKRTNAF